MCIYLCKCFCIWVQYVAACVWFSTFKIVKDILPSWSAEWGREAILVDRHGHFSPDSNILPHFPWYRRPPLPAGLTALTSRPNPQNSLPSTSIPPSSSLSALFSSLNPSGASSWWIAPQERVAGRVRPAFWNFFSAAAQRRRKTNWGKIGTDLRGREKWRKNMLGAKEVLKKILKIGSLYKQFLPIAASAVSTSSSHLSPADHHILIFHHLRLP